MLFTLLKIETCQEKEKKNQLGTDFGLEPLQEHLRGVD